MPPFTRTIASACLLGELVRDADVTASHTFD
jgi:hypothetical protein